MDPRRAADERKERVRLRYPLCGLCGHHYDRRLAQTPVFGSLRSRRHLYPAMSDAEIEKHLCASPVGLSHKSRNPSRKTGEVIGPKVRKFVWNS